MIASMKRMMVESTHRPANPAMAPSGMPKKAPKKTAPVAISNAVRAPKTIRL